MAVIAVTDITDNRGGRSAFGLCLPPLEGFLGEFEKPTPNSLTRMNR
jgi:hypothetical protein